MFYWGIKSILKIFQVALVHYFNVYVQYHYIDWCDLDLNLVPLLDLSGDQVTMVLLSIAFVIEWEIIWNAWQGKYTIYHNLNY